MEKEHRAYKSHFLVLPYPSQGHINPMFEFSKLLDKKQVKVTLVTTRCVSKRMHRGSSVIQLETISDGYDDGWKGHAESLEAYFERFWQVGAETLGELLEKLSSSGCPVDCIVYDSVMPWALDVAKNFGIVAAAFFTQSCVVENIYYQVNKGLLKLPLPESEISLPGMPPLLPEDCPSFIYDLVSYPAYFDAVIGQFSNIEKADWILCNTFYELEQKAVDWMADILPVKTVGPTILSSYLNKQLEDDDKECGISLLKYNNDAYMKWLNEQHKGSVVYVSFGSGAELNVEQMGELACGLRRSKSRFLWVVRESEADKLVKGFAEDTSEKGLVVSWCSQLDVLANEAVGCFITHCGWNSTLEALSLGVPLVAMPQYNDQTTNAKYIKDVWKIGVKAQPDEKGIVRQEELEHCISEIMEGERGKEIQKNAFKWKDLARKAVIQGGSSDKNIDEFIETLVKH